MIEINLLPADLKSKAESRKIYLHLEAKYFIYLVVFVLTLLICLHIYLATLVMNKYNQLTHLNNKWRSLEPQRKLLEDFNKENTSATQDTFALAQLNEERITWSEKLRKLNSSLPGGIWFTELSFSGRDFSLRGSVVSLQKEEIALIKKFIDNLKSDMLFYKNFNDLELSSVQRKVIGEYDVLDFTLIGTLR